MKIWPFIVGALVLGAGFGGTQVRRKLEMGPPVQDTLTATTDQKKLLASTTNVPSSNESDFFYELLTVIKQNYVEPVDDEQKLSLGAVRGMVNSLADPNVQYLNDKQFPAFERAMKGEFEGIGVELRLVYDKDQLQKFHAAQDKLADWNANGRKDVDGKLEELPSMESGGLIPDVVVSSVMPGSPAEKAGLKPGDQIDGVDGKWSISRSEVLELNRAFDRMRLGSTERDAYLKLREKYIKRSDNAIPAARLIERLTAGTEGSVRLVWKSAGKPPQTATVAKALTTVKPLVGDRLIFMKGVADEVSGKTVFDLRGSGFGDFSAMKEALSKLLPTGDYGRLSKENKPFHVEGSGSLAPPLTLRVDSTTTGAARFFAAVLKSAGRAKLDGDLGPDPILAYDTITVQGGTAYILPTAIYTGDTK